MLSQKIFTNLHITTFNIGFSVGGGVGWGGVGWGRRNVYLHIVQIMQGSLGLTRGAPVLLLGVRPNDHS